MKKVLIILLLTTLAFSQQNFCKTNYTSLCFSSSNSTFCSDHNHTILDLSNQKDIENRIFLIQNKIRESLNSKATENLILLAEGFDATLLFIAQHNLLPYYRKQIKGLVLKKSSSNFYYECKKNRNIENNITCNIIDEFYSRLNKKVSKDELLKSLSPALQMDWYESKVVVVDIKSREERARWGKAFNENSITHLIFKKSKKLNLEKWFPIKKSFKVQPKKKKEKKPNHFGAILEFHLGKILYESNRSIVSNINIAYGDNPLQTYDLFYDDSKKTEMTPLFIYVHGGGWINGDKSSFTPLCKSYVDRGFRAININYRLLNLPTVTLKMMVDDVKVALETILDKNRVYNFDKKNITIMADSSGSQLLFMAITELKSSRRIHKIIFNTIPTDLMLYSDKKRFKLTGEDKRKKQEKILKPLSPLFHLMDYHPPTLVIQALDDEVVNAKQLEMLEIQSVINYNNIESIWIENGKHPTSPNSRSLQPNYHDIWKRIERD